jgi:hypothetical protein
MLNYYLQGRWFCPVLPLLYRLFLFFRPGQREAAAGRRYAFF